MHDERIIAFPYQNTFADYWIVLLRNLGLLCQVLAHQIDGRVAYRR